MRCETHPRIPTGGSDLGSEVADWLVTASALLALF